eukprot:3633054-Rhodomonas_salina.1
MQLPSPSKLCRLSHPLPQPENSDSDSNPTAVTGTNGLGLGPAQGASTPFKLTRTAHWQESSSSSAAGFEADSGSR